jgi:hypothetical protein
MPDHETPAERHGRLAAENLESARSFPLGKQREALIQMAQVWQRLADQYDDATPPFSAPREPEKPVMQQQHRGPLSEANLKMFSVLRLLVLPRADIDRLEIRQRSSRLVCSF